MLSKCEESAKKPDFLFVAGNDRDDEVVFKWAKKLKEDSAIPSVQTVTVGDRNSVALSTLPNGTTGKLFTIQNNRHFANTSQVSLVP